MARLLDDNGLRIIKTTFGELMEKANWTLPNEWGMLGSHKWKSDDVIKFTEIPERNWARASRQADDGEWHAFLDEEFEIDSLWDSLNPSEDKSPLIDNGKDYSHITISYSIGNRTEGFGDCGRASAIDILVMYKNWLEPALEQGLPRANISVTYYPPQRWDYEEVIDISGASNEAEREDIREIIQRVVETFEYQGFMELPTLEELQTAPYLYALPSEIIQQIIRGEDPFDPNGDHSKIFATIAQYDRESPPSDMARIHQRIAEADGSLGYLWEVEMRDYTIGEGRVHEPIARAVLEGLDPRPIYDAWKNVQELNVKRNELRKLRDFHQGEMLSLRNQLGIIEKLIAADDQLIALTTEQISQSVDAHNNKKSPQWDAYRALAAHAREAKREHDYQRILVTFDALLEAGDPRVRRSGSGSPVFVAEDGSTVVHPGMGVGAGAEYCPTWWFLLQFEERGIALVEVELVD